jgi:hypothetical protein
MDPRGAHHSGNVRRGRSHVCCVDTDLAAIGPHARKIPSPAFGTSGCRGSLLTPEESATQRSAIHGIVAIVRG